MKYFFRQRMTALALITALVIPLVSSAESRYEAQSDSAVTAGVIGTAGNGATFDLVSGNFFATDDDFGKDLYQVVYERVRSEASDLAITRTLGSHNLTEEELFALIPGSNIGKLLTEEDPLKKLSAAEIRKRHDEVIAQLAEEKEVADLEVMAQIEVQPTEIFSNGDESDSGFDLIVDLNIIEALLFGESENVLGNAGPGGGGDAQPAQGREQARARAARVPRGGGRQNVRPLNQANARQGLEAQHDSDSGQAGDAAESPENVPAVCPIDEIFNDAVEAARVQEQAAEAAAEAGENDGGDGLGVVEAGLQAGENAADAGGIADDGSIVPAAEVDWSRPRACSNVFCLTIQKKYKKESSYNDFDNCIACHIEKINDAFKKTLSHNLVPSKVTGNLFEGPKCKGGLLGLFDGGGIFSFTIVPIPQPILTPPNDDLIPKGDFVRNMINFYEKYYDNPGRCKGQGVGGDCKPDPKPEIEIPARALQQAPEGASVNAVLNSIKRQVEIKKAEAEKLLEQSRREADASAQSSQFSVIGQQLDTMNAFFKSFQKLFSQLGNPQNPESPCKRLLDKETCG